MPDGSVSTGAEQVRSDAPGAAPGNGSPPADDGGNGKTQTTDANHVFATGYGKGREAAEREWKAREAKLRAEILRDLGMESDADIAAHKEARKKAEESQPEYVRRARESERKALDATTRLAEMEKARDEWVDRWFTAYRSGIASELAIAANLHAEARDDLDSYLDRCLTCEKEGEPLTFRDGEVSVDMDDPKAMEKLAGHVAKRKPLWVKPNMASGGGTSMVRAPNVGGGKPLTPREARDQFARETVQALGIVRKG